MIFRAEQAAMLETEAEPDNNACDSAISLLRIKQ
jgi:hypothetical protein